MTAQDDFEAAVKALALDIRPGRHVVAAAFCKDHPPHQRHHLFGPCPSCAFHESPYSGEVRRLDRLHAALPTIAELFEVCAAFVAEYPDLGREHVDGEPCDDYACGIVTRMRALAKILTADGEQTPTRATEETDRP